MLKKSLVKQVQNRVSYKVLHNVSCIRSSENTEKKVAHCGSLHCLKMLDKMTMSLDPEGRVIYLLSGTYFVTEKYSKNVSFFKANTVGNVFVKSDTGQTLT